jgi:hypothetical protein
MTTNLNQQGGNRRRSLSAAPAPYQFENSKSKSTFLSRFKNTPLIQPSHQQQQEQYQVQPTATHSSLKTTNVNNNGDNDGLPSIIPQYQKIKRKPISPNNSEPSIYKDVELIRGIKKSDHDNIVPENANSKKVRIIYSFSV